MPCQRKKAYPANTRDLQGDEDDGPLVHSDHTVISDDEDDHPLVQPVERKEPVKEKCDPAADRRSLGVEFQPIPLPQAFIEACGRPSFVAWPIEESTLNLAVHRFSARRQDTLIHFHNPKIRRWFSELLCCIWQSPGRQMERKSIALCSFS